MRKMHIYRSYYILKTFTLSLYFDLNNLLQNAFFFVFITPCPTVLKNLFNSRLIEDWPNTYVFTKAEAEEIVRLNGKDLPISVFRPSIGKQFFISKSNVIYASFGYILFCLLWQSYGAHVRYAVK